MTNKTRKKLWCSEEFREGLTELAWQRRMSASAVLREAVQAIAAGKVDIERLPLDHDDKTAYVKLNVKAEDWEAARSFLAERAVSLAPTVRRHVLAQIRDTLK